MHRKLSLLAVMALAAWPALSSANSIDFDILNPGASGAPPTYGETVSTQYSGVLFSPGNGGASGLSLPEGGAGYGQGWATNTSLAVTNWDYPGEQTAGVNEPAGLSNVFLHGHDAWNSSNGNPVFTIDFANAISAFSLSFGNVATFADSRIFAVDASNNVIASAAATQAGENLVSLTLASAVKRIVVTPGNYHQWVGVDNINYTPAAAPPSGSVPEPSSLALLAIGLGGLARRRPARA